MILLAPANLNALCSPNTPSLAIISPNPVSHALSTTNFAPLKLRLEISYAVRIPSSWFSEFVVLLAPANIKPDRNNGLSESLIKLEGS